MYTRRELDAFVAADGEGRERITKRELIRLWATVESHQAEVAKCLAIFNAWLNACPDLARDWRKFSDAGGLTVQELRRFLAGKTIRLRRMRTKRHLRMVVNNRRRPMVLKTSRHGDDDAA